MGSIHGRRPMLRNRNSCQQTQAGEYTVPLPQRRCVDGAPRATQQISISHANFTRMHPRQLRPLDHCARFYASTHAEAYCDANRTAQASQNRSSYPQSIARSVLLAAAWPSAAAPFFCDRIAARVSNAGNTRRGDFLRLKLKEDA